MIHFLCLSLIWQSIQAATIDVTIHFSESSLNNNWFTATEDRVFGVNFFSCQSEINTPRCPGGQALFVDDLWVREDDKTASDTWLKILDTGSVYTGSVIVDVWAPLPFEINSDNELVFSSSITDCTDPHNFEMSQEICARNGQPWTLDVTDPSQHITIDIYPNFAIGQTGNSSVLLWDFYSPQLNNSREIPVYVPHSLVQNKVQRNVDIMIVLDGSLSTIQSYSLRTGFESGQLMGSVPESIMIGINTLSFAYDLDFNQRTYELTYEESLPYPTGSCIGMYCSVHDVYVFLFAIISPLLIFHIPYV
jgi:hypothetical protein